jgi:hypothetical protein
MATSAECNDAWERGYVEGWAAFKPATKPSVPSRPASFPPGVDPLDHFYREGYARGKNDGLRNLAGIDKG